MAEIIYTDLLALVEQDGFKAVRTSTSRGVHPSWIPVLTQRTIKPYTKDL